MSNIYDIYNLYGNYGLEYMLLNPLFTPTDDRPPKLYFFMESIVNFGKPQEEKVPLTKLSSVARSTIFDFNYPLDPTINKEEFEENILDHFIQRRIGYETYTAWNIALKNKLREIMPKYNILFKACNNWDLFANGHKITKESLNTNESKVTNNMTSSSNNEATQDLRNAETPENRLEDVKNGNYITEYNYNQAKGSDTSVSNGNSTANDTNNLSESTTFDVDNKLEAFIKFQDEVSNVYTRIYKDLDSLFYQLV